RQFAQALVVTAATDPASVLRVVLDDGAVARHYALARTVVAPGLAAPPRAPDDALLRRLEAADVLLAGDADSAARWQPWSPLAGLVLQVLAEPAQALAWPVTAPAAPAALAARTHLS